MARADLIINLVRSSISGDASTLRRTVEAIIAEERSKQHNVMADKMEKLLEANPTAGATNLVRLVSEQTSRAKDYIAEIAPKRTLGDLTLPETSRLAIEQLIEEQTRASLLRSHSIEPRHKILLIGPPGNGKTSLAEAIAESLSLPLFVVRYESMIGSFLGETASRLKRVFDYVRTTPCVLFFDEFDALGKERGDQHETGEIKRVVTSLLMQIDDLPSYVVVVTATNHPELLDKAVWRRFQLRLKLPAPTHKALVNFLDALSRKTGHELGMKAELVAKALGKVSFSEAEEFFMDTIRRRILSMEDRTSPQIVKEQLKLWAMRSESSGKSSGR